MQEVKSVSKLSFEYSTSNDDEKFAFTQFQRIFTLKKRIIMIIILAILSALFLEQVLRNTSYTLGYIGLGVSVFLLFFNCINPFLIRKNLMKALKTIENDIYSFELFDNKMEITTVKINEDIDEDEEENDENEEKEPVVYKPTVINFDNSTLSIIEYKEMFIIFLAKQSFFVLSKKFINNEQQEVMRDVFKNTLGEKFKTKNL